MDVLLYFYFLFDTKINSQQRIKLCQSCIIPWITPTIINSFPSFTNTTNSYHAQVGGWLGLDTTSKDQTSYGVFLKGTSFCPFYIEM